MEESKEKELTKEEKQKWISFLREKLNNVLRVVQGGRVKHPFRAMRRGKITIMGTLTPSRPFNNRANTSKRKGVNSRVGNEERRRIYEAFKRKSDKQSL